MKKYSKAEKQKAIKKIVELINKYHLIITTEHQIKILPFETEDTSDE